MRVCVHGNDVPVHVTVVGVHGTAVGVHGVDAVHVHCSDECVRACTVPMCTCTVLRFECDP